MSSSKSNKELLKFIEYYLTNINESSSKNLEFEIRFGTKAKKAFTKDDIDNVVKKLLSNGFNIIKNNSYKLNITNEFLDLSGDIKQTSNIRTEIEGIHNIKKYCKTNDIQENMNSLFLQKKREKIPNLFNPFDIKKFNMRYSIQEEKELDINSGQIQTLLSTWNESKKFFRLINRMELTHPDLPFRVDISTVKSSKKNKGKLAYSYTIEESNLFNNKQYYEIEIELLNDYVKTDIAKFEDMKTALMMYERKIKQSIKLILSAIQQSNFPIDENEKDNIMNEYLKLIGKEDKKSIYQTDFIGPSTLTLQKINLIDDPNQIIPSVLKNYTVTEKADGMRKMLYISNEGKIYFITMNMNIQFTGVISQNSNLFKSLFDGEHVLYSKTGVFINKYLCFDAYFIQGKDVRNELFIENELQQDKVYRLKFALESIENLKEKYVSIKNISNLKIDVKDFFLTNEEKGRTIFDICNVMLKREKENYYEYETDGLVFTPQKIAVGVNNEGDSPENYKITWEHSFKWKPPEFNTIDFLVEIEKDGINDLTKIKTQDGINMSKKEQLMYKVLKLKVGYRRKDGHVNPLLAIIEGQTNNDEDDKSYKPGIFYPTSPYDNKAHICNIELKTISTGEKEIITEEGDIIEDNSIVEFKYVKENDSGWNWVPLRVRHDKTNELRVYKNNFGNSYQTANNNWYSIHNPITHDMLTTGEGIFMDSSDDDVYYNKKKDQKSYTKIMRDFHNLFVKRILIQKYSNSDTRLMDFAVGKGGDFPKWIHSKIRFVFGVDISRDNIENKLDGVCARYLKYKKKYNKIPEVMFLQGDSTKDLIRGQGYSDERSIMIQNAILGIGTKDKKMLGSGVYDLYGIANKLFDITSIQFALHYMFKDKVTLHTFLKNVSNFTKIGGHFIGGCYDGKRVFKYLSKVNNGESRNIIKNDRKINSIKRQYDSNEFNNDESCLGYTIDVYQETINQYIREYLVNFDYFTELMSSYGFKLESNPFIKSKKEALGSFEELFNLLLETKKQNKEYEHIKDMSDEEKIISFMNNYFIYVKITEVDVESVYNSYI